MQKADDIYEVEDVATLGRFCVEGKGWKKNSYPECLCKWGKWNTEVGEGNEVNPGRIEIEKMKRGDSSR